MKIDFEKIRAGAEAEAQRRSEEMRESLARVGKAGKNNANLATEALSHLSKRLDEAKQEEMMRETERAKAEAELAVKARYHNENGSQDWNRSEADKGMIDTIKSLR